MARIQSGALAIVCVDTFRSAIAWDNDITDGERRDWYCMVGYLGCECVSFPCGCVRDAAADLYAMTAYLLKKP